jgi:hypothetical protein
MAEISVPAWPMPIHQTKLTMANPQPMGMLIPQMPTPVTNRYVTATRSTITSKKLTAKPRIHHFGVRRVRMIAPILSVTEA